MLSGIIALAAISALFNPSFLTPENMTVILRQTSILLILSLGLTGVVLTGNIDLSVGANAALTGCVCAKLLVMKVSVPISIACSLSVGMITGIANGLLVGLLSLPSFVATYGINMLVSGIAMIIMNGGVIYDLPRGFTRIGIGYLGWIPVPVLAAGILFVLFFLLYRKTTLGRNIYMIGLNRQAAEYSAVSSFFVLMAVYVLCGFTASAGGIILTARLNAADAGMSETYGLQIIAAVAVGGTSLLGGEGGIEGTLFGALILTMIINIMNMNLINSSWQNFVLGIIILFVVFINISLLKKRSR